ncbi:hypothetical protein, partial [Enterococcus faecium]|uniref:hypothetical protein n=1 Tax=Enterococcus faecium TaxID=1352 RepID=UPI0034E982D2
KYFPIISSPALILGSLNFINTHQKETNGTLFSSKIEKIACLYFVTLIDATAFVLVNLET